MLGTPASHRHVDRAFWSANLSKTEAMVLAPPQALDLGFIEDEHRTINDFCQLSPARECWRGVCSTLTLRVEKGQSLEVARTGLPI